MQDFERTIISQFANSPVLLQLIDGFNQCLDPAANFDEFISYVFDVTTATGFGLDILGRIVNIDRKIIIPAADDYFGFQSAFQPFNQQTFYFRGSGLPPNTTYTLNNTDYRRLILVKALSNISDCSIRSINTILRNLFAGRGVTFVRDLGGMQMEYVFQFAIEPFERAIVFNSGAIFHPTGVGVNIAVIPNDFLLGFNEADDYQPFGGGTLYPG